ncbi:hypothetical protein FHX45_002614 [Amycolatopsis granulosa]|nr:hypothetical protein [Amycolatopsis granulosa]
MTKTGEIRTLWTVGADRSRRTTPGAGDDKQCSRAGPATRRSRERPATSGITW